jgi:TonB family protein
MARSMQYRYAELGSHSMPGRQIGWPLEKDLTLCLLPTSMKHLFSSRLLLHALKATAVFYLVLGLPWAARAQAAKRDTLGQAKVYTAVEQMPQLPKASRKDTGQQAVIAAIQRACRYPAEALRNRVQGTVLVGFTVNQQGEVRDVRVEKGLSTDLDEATVAAVKTLPLFRPGKQGGQNVAVRYTLPIRWALQ